MGGRVVESSKLKVQSWRSLALSVSMTDDAYGIILGMKQKNSKLMKIDLSTALEMTEAMVEMTGEMDLSTALETTEARVEMTGGAV